MKANKIYYLLCVVLLIVGFVISLKLPDGTYKQTEKPSNLGLSQSIDAENIYCQYFDVDNSVNSIYLKFATWGKNLTGEYIFEIGQGEHIIYEQIIQGAEIKDNAYYEIKLPDIINKGNNYFFTISAIDSYEEKLNLWMTETSDVAGDLYLNDNKQNSQINFVVSEKIFDNRIVVGIVVMLLFMVAILIPCMKDKWILLIYVLGFAIIISRMIYNYKYEWLGLYDDMAHISYLTYVEKNDDIIPRFEEMKLLISEGAEINGTNQTQPLLQNRGIFRGIESNTVCYLCHPPLYYWFLSIFNGVEITDAGVVVVNLSLLRCVNAVLFLLSVMLIFYIGYTRIEKKASHHLLYVSIISSLPMFSILCLTINNDNLLFLFVAVTFLGAIRFSEAKKDLLTYALIAVGLCGTVMVKLTAGLILVIAAIGIIICDILKEKNCNVIINKHMLFTLPLYLITLAYYAVIYIRYGKMQLGVGDLISTEEFQQYSLLNYPDELKVRYGLFEFIDRFFDIFFGQWINGTYTYTHIENLEQYNFIKGMYMIFFVTLIIQISLLLKKDSYHKVLGAFSLGITITILSELYISYNSHFETGRCVGQSRYYVCALFIMALIFIEFIKSINKKFIPQDKDYVRDIVCIYLSSVFLYSGWIVYFSFG